MELTYCLKCKKKTTSKDINIIKSKNGVNRKASICCICNSKKSQFIKS